VRFASFLFCRIRSSFFVALAAPVVSFTSGENIAGSDGGLVTVTGLDFRSSDLTASVGLGSQGCGTASWSSGTSVVCAASAGTGSGAAAVVTVGGVVGTRTGGFTFDGQCFVAT